MSDDEWQTIKHERLHSNEYNLKYFFKENCIYYIQDKCKKENCNKIHIKDNKLKNKLNDFLKNPTEILKIDLKKIKKDIKKDKFYINICSFYICGRKCSNNTFNFDGYDMCYTDKNNIIGVHFNDLTVKNYKISLNHNKFDTIDDKFDDKFDKNDDKFDVNDDKIDINDDNKFDVNENTSKINYDETIKWNKDIDIKIKLTKIEKKDYFDNINDKIITVKDKNNDELIEIIEELIKTNDKMYKTMVELKYINKILNLPIPITKIL